MQYTALHPVAPARLWRLQIGLVMAVALGCLAGLFSQPIGYLAALWPANAIMLGLLLRHPALGRAPLTWCYALATYIVVAWLTGVTAFVAFSWNTANVLGVWAAWLYLHRQHREVLSFQRQRSVGVVFVGCVMGAAASAVPGAWASSVAFGDSLWAALALWLSGEFFNYLLFLPVLLAAPQGWIWQWPRTWQHWSLSKVWPLVALAVSEMLSLLIGGPGAMAFVMPAMVWCAMTYRVFTITWLNLVVCLGQTTLVALSAFRLAEHPIMETISFRTGLALLSLAPLAVACASVLRLQALDKLHHAVSHDFLTGVLGRRALMERGQKLLMRLQAERQPLAVLMADLDHFKHVNDCYGHAQGDVVLQEFAAIAAKALRPEDLLGRMGGEEFAILLPRTTHEQALAIGQRLCDLMRLHTFQLEPHHPLHVTVSVGLHAVSSLGPQDSLEYLLSKADEALYLAKNNGRNQVQHYRPSLAPTPL